MVLWGLWNQIFQYNMNSPTKVSSNSWGGDCMKKKKWIFSVAMIFILIGCISIVIMSRPKNDITSMEKMISKRIKANETVMVYNEIVIDDYRLDSYILKDAKEYQKVGYALFRVNRDGNYEILNVIDADKTIKIADDITLYEFSQLRAGDFSINTSLFVISNNPQLAKIERIMENGEIKIKEVTDNPSISFFDDLDRSSKARYNFYDKNGDILKF